MTLEAIPVETLVPGGLNRAGQVMGEGPYKLQRLALRVGEWVMGQCPIPVKKYIITETRRSLQDSRLTEKCGGLLSDGAPRGEVGKVSVPQDKSYSILNEY